MKARSVSIEVPYATGATAVVTLTEADLRSAVAALGYRLVRACALCSAEIPDDPLIGVCGKCLAERS